MRYATIEEFTSEFVRRRPRAAHRGLQGRFRSADVRAHRRRPVPRRPRPDERGVLPHLQRPPRLRPPAGAHLRPPAGRARRARGPPGRALPLRASWWSSSRPALDVREAILAKRARLDGVEVGPDVLAEIAARGHQQHPGPRGRADPRGRLRLAPRAGAHAGARAPRAPAPRRPAQRRALRDRRHPRRRGQRVRGRTSRDLVARDRRPAVATARQVAMYLARELTDHSLPEIGRGVGGRNHATVHPRRSTASGPPC